MKRSTVLPRSPGPCRGPVRGVSLPELLTGLAIGLLLALAAVGLLASSRVLSGQTLDGAELVAQANNAMRLIGSQSRPAGAVELQLLNPTAPLSEHTFVYSSQFDGLDLDGDGVADGGHVWGLDGRQGSADTLVLSSENRSASISPDCLGAGTAKTLHRVDSRFFVSRGRLMCRGSSNAAVPQPVVESLEDFQVRYALRLGAGDSATLQWLDADQMAGRWPQVLAVQVCLQLVGAVGGPRLEGRSFQGCNGLDQAHEGRRHIVLRNTFVLRGVGRVR